MFKSRILYYLIGDHVEQRDHAPWSWYDISTLFW